jgi:aspartate racemase
MIGILGGMGPAATVDLMAKLARLTAAEREQDQPPIVVVSDPRVPDRVAPILEGRGASPLPHMLAGVRRLERAGATCIAIPCHTAHVWYEQLAAVTTLPVLSIIDAVLADLARRQVPKGPLGLLATAATLHAALYQPRLEAAGYPCVIPDRATMADVVLPAIRLVKLGHARDAAPLLCRAVEALRARGAGLTLLACTELPLAWAAAGDPPSDCLDATEALARYVVTWYRERS